MLALLNGPSVGYVARTHTRRLQVSLGRAHLSALRNNQKQFNHFSHGFACARISLERMLEAQRQQQQQQQLPHIARLGCQLADLRELRARAHLQAGGRAHARARTKPIFCFAAAASQQQRQWRYRCTRSVCLCGPHWNHDDYARRTRYGESFDCVINFHSAGFPSAANLSPRRRPRPSSKRARVSFSS